MPMSSKNEKIIVRMYRPTDFKNLANSGYIFGIQSFQSDRIIQNLKIRALNALGGDEEEQMIALHVSERRIVGAITLRKITDTLYGIWNIFVNPEYRGRGIASSLYRSAFRYLAGKGVKKAVGIVAVDNTSSARGIAKTWDGFLSKRFYILPSIRASVISRIHDQPLEFRKISIRRALKDHRNALFRTYRDCAGEQWCSFLETNSNNFIERFIYYQPHSQRFLSVMHRGHALIAKDRLTECYAVATHPRMIRSTTLHLFLSAHLSGDTFERLVTDAILQVGMGDIENVLCLAGDESRLEAILSELGLRAVAHMVPFKYLQINA
jgi:ribosomal protein S18 acetylase RimI-like enzyme